MTFYIDVLRIFCFFHDRCSKCMFDGCRKDAFVTDIPPDTVCDLGIVARTALMVELVSGQYSKNQQ